MKALQGVGFLEINVNTLLKENIMKYIVNKLKRNNERKQERILELTKLFTQIYDSVECFNRKVRCTINITQVWKLNS